MSRIFLVISLFVLSSCGLIRPEDSYYREAIKYKNEGDAHRAIDSLRKVVSTAPKSKKAKDALYLLGDLYYQIGDPKKAIKVLETYIDISAPNDERRFDVFNKMGLVVYSRTNDYPRALMYYKKAIPLADSKREKFDVSLNVGNCYFKMYRFDKALDFFSNAVKQMEDNPDDEESQYLQEALYYMAFSYSLLTKDLNESTELSESTKSQDLFSDPQKKIIAILDKCLKYSASSKYGILCKYQKAEAFEELGDRQKAISIYMELKELYPNKGVIEAKISKLSSSNTQAK